MYSPYAKQGEITVKDVEKSIEPKMLALLNEREWFYLRFKRFAVFLPCFAKEGALSIKPKVQVSILC